MAPTVIIAIFYGPVAAGFFALSQRVIGSPVRILAQSASQLFMTQFRSRFGVRLYRLFLAFTVVFLAVGISFMTPLLTHGPQLFAIIFGEEWREAGDLVRYLVPMFIARFVAVPVAQSLNVLDAQRFHLYSALIAIAALGLASWLAKYHGLPFHDFILIYSLGIAVSFFTLWVRCLKELRAGAIAG